MGAVGSEHIEVLLQMPPDVVDQVFGADNTLPLWQAEPGFFMHRDEELLWPVTVVTRQAAGLPADLSFCGW